MKLLFILTAIGITAGFIGLLTSCGVPFTITHNEDGTTVVTPPPVIRIPSRSAK